MNLGSVVQNWHQPLVSMEDASFFERGSAHLSRCSLRYEKDARRRLRYKAQGEPRRFSSRASGIVVGVNPHVWEEAVQQA